MSFYKYKVGKLVKHKAFGVGKITAIEGTSIAVDFDKVGLTNSAWKRKCWNSFDEI